MSSARALRAAGGAVVRAFESGMVRRAAATSGSRYAIGGAARLPRGRFLAPTGFAPSARVAFNRGKQTTGAVKQGNRRGGRAVGASGATAPNRNSEAARFLSICAGRGGEKFLRHLATQRIARLEGFVQTCIGRARQIGNQRLADEMIRARDPHIGVEIKGVLDALRSESKRLHKADLQLSDSLRVIRDELYDIACHEAGVRRILRKTVRTVRLF